MAAKAKGCQVFFELLGRGIAVFRGAQGVQHNGVLISRKAAATRGFGPPTMENGFLFVFKAKINALDQVTTERAEIDLSDKAIHEFYSEADNQRGYEEFLGSTLKEELKESLVKTCRIGNEQNGMESDC